jgi:glycerophosphoryl diester phosphodiesterase
MSEIFAHRGARAAAPENTLPAFALALDMHVDGIEMDVQCSRDGALVVMHDWTVDRTTDGSGKVSELSLSELRRLDAGSHFGSEFAGTPTPTLDEVLDLIGDRCRVNVEIKTEDYRGGDEVDVLAQVIAQRNLYDQVIVSSFNPIALVKMRHVDARIKLGLLYFEPLPEYLCNAWLSPLMAPEALHPHHRLLDAESVARAKSLHKAVNTWTVNDVDEARRLDALGVDVIITDVPDVLSAGLAFSPGGRA